ncbi:MAG: orotidine-5'-phosphate decarboxylase [Deltaproteobacteria bacterium]|nr:orotidine-5'-phosphate decarboxylase [Deltaproteobacteria bacterium]
MPALVVALDFPEAAPALEMAKMLRGVTPWMKVGLELFTAAGPDLLARLKAIDCLVFLDLKFHDIPNTVAGAVAAAVRAGADICNIHIDGGKRMARAAVEAKREALLRSGCMAAAKPDRACLLLGVTVLTSSSPQEAGLSDRETLRELVRQKALQAKDWGLDGVVCSGWEANAIKQSCGKDFICLCPGIRPAGAELDDQQRVLTPAEAVARGADFLVVGRPITRAHDPLLAAQSIMDSMQEK